MRGVCLRHHRQERRKQESEAAQSKIIAKESNAKMRFYRPGGEAFTLRTCVAPSEDGARCQAVERERQRIGMRSEIKIHRYVT